ncbi:hypothetical protein Y032_0019g3910 [Ancylostoma ceylanicum]|uniref:Major sperm protein n=1 Tax=Ancylostoma ceylanicum TaxID=53326 RepID=A0A016V2D2_9BILA|nr:hypothetical protein Y032_0019g3910 [Ancylostoma ceylanicum]
MSKDQELDDLVDVPAGENEETPRQKSTKPQETGKRIESKEKIPVKSEQTRSSEERRRGKKGGKKHTSKKRKTRRKGAQTAGSRSESATDNVDLQIEIDTQGVTSNKTDILWKRYGGKKRFQICNKTDSIHAIKMRCSDNGLFRITPSMTSIQPNETLHVTVHRTRSPIKPDKIVVLVTPTARLERHLKELFQIPDLPINKVTVNQRVEASRTDLLAYYGPCAPPGIPCLKFDHVKILFNSRVGGDQSLRITNGLYMRIGVKIQCTDNFLYKFKPIFTTMERRETIRIKVTRSPHPKKRDKMVVCFTVLKNRISIDDLPDLFDTKGLKITEVAVPLNCA